MLTFERWNNDENPLVMAAATSAIITSGFIVILVIFLIEFFNLWKRKIKIVFGFHHCDANTKWMQFLASVCDTKYKPWISLGYKIVSSIRQNMKINILSQLEEAFFHEIYPEVDRTKWIFKLSNKNSIWILWNSTMIFCSLLLLLKKYPVPLNWDLYDALESYLVRHI